jgi:glycosyltransferase involved in cell wall biosynthesis
MPTCLLSIVVCTYNRAEILTGCLKSLSEQIAPSEYFEIIVVDNNSTDTTQKVVEFFCKKYNNFRLVKEYKQGLSHARNRGWQDAKGEYVAYLDDDALAPSDWVCRIKSFIDRRPAISAFGGPYVAYSLVPIPDWFPPEYGNHSLGEEERPIVAGNEWINGTNMILKKQLLHDLDGFDHNLGMTGSSISYGEEINFFVKLNDRKIVIYYVPNIIVKHLVAEYKMDIFWLFKSAYKVGRCYRLTFNIDRTLISCLSNVAACLLVGSYNYLNSSDKLIKRKLYYSFNNLFIELGVLTNYLTTRYINTN